MNTVMPEVKKLQIMVKVINIVCPCGGNCEDGEGERAISSLDKIVLCRLCGTRYEVPVEAFPKFEQAPTITREGKLRRLDEIDKIVQKQPRPSAQEALPLLQEAKQLTQDLRLERAYVRYARLIDRIEHNVW